MFAKLIYFGEGVNIPSSSIGLGLSFISVWIDGNGFTAASNDVGALGYAFLNTPELDIGQPDPETAAIFQNLHGQVVRFEITPNLFVISGGIARIKLSVDVQTDGQLVERSIEWVASNCRGVSVVSNPISFFAEMLQLPVSTAQAEVPEEDLVALADAAPQDVIV
jgi:hypothetical protein